jgi:hypothetical protein
MALPACSGVRQCYQLHMSGDIEAIGDVLTGGLAARAVEPETGQASGDNGQRCLNCGTFLNGPYCNRCGQRGHVHRSALGFVQDILHGVLHFEGKLWHTLPLLFWRPGELTRRYINGERARFFSPLALFLFAVFLTFAIFSAMGSGLGNPNQAAIEGDTLTVTQRQNAVYEVTKNMAAEIAASEQRLADARAAGQPTDELERQLAAKKRVAEGMTQTFGFGVNADGEAQRPKSFSFTDIKTGVPVIDQMIDTANADPALMLYKLQSNAYKYAWALIPLSAPFLWLLYPFSRRFGMYDHLVFVTFSLSFLLLLLVLSRVLSAMGVGGPFIPLLLLFYPPFHMYRQLRGTYRSSRIGALVRTTILVTVASINLSLFMAGLLALGALG